VTLPERFSNLYSTQPQRRRELLKNLENSEENRDLTHKQKQLLKAIDQFSTFYQPTREESLYNKYYELKVEYENKLMTRSSPSCSNIKDMADYSDNNIGVSSDESERSIIRQNDEEEEESDHEEEEIHTSSTHDEDISIFLETLNRVFRRGENINLNTTFSNYSNRDSKSTHQSLLIEELSESNGNRSQYITGNPTDNLSTTIRASDNLTYMESAENNLTPIPNKHQSITSDQIAINIAMQIPSEPTTGNNEVFGWLYQMKDMLVQQYKDYKDKGGETRKRGSTPHVRHSRKAVDSYYSSYCIFRQEKIRNPFIRSKLLRVYITQIKKRYTPVTRWLNHVKLISCSFLAVFVVLTALNLDKYIEWPWFVCFAPLVLASCLAIFLVLILWTPTIGWPIVLYRWVSGDSVGFWSAYAYCLSPRGRIVQLLVGVVVLLTPCCTLFISLFPDVPLYIPGIIVAVGFFIWMYTCTQVIYSVGKKPYPYLLFLMCLCLEMFFGSMILKMAVPFFILNVKWYITCSPLYLCVLLIISKLVII